MNNSRFDKSLDALTEPENVESTHQCSRFRRDRK